MCIISPVGFGIIEVLETGENDLQKHYLIGGDQKMLKEWVKEDRPLNDELTARLEKARADLAVRQMMVKEKNLPVLVVFDGWGGRWKGKCPWSCDQGDGPKIF